MTCLNQYYTKHMIVYLLVACLFQVRNLFIPKVIHICKILKIIYKDNTNPKIVSYVIILRLLM